MKKKVKITDFIIAMGEICELHSSCDSPYCFGCPFNIDDGNFHGCIRDKQCNPKFAEIIKKETIKYMISK